MMRTRNTLLTLATVLLAALGIYILTQLPNAGGLVSALTLVFIWGIAAISLNLINGQLGILSLGHHGFMLIGGYVTALLVLPEQERSPFRTRLLSEWARENLDLDKWLRGLGLDFLANSMDAKFIIALLIAGAAAALVGFIVGFPSLRLKGDYLAIVTFGFGEIIRLLPSTPEVARFTNGPLGIKGIPADAGSIWWAFTVFVLTIFFFSRLKYSSYGRAFEGIREDEIAAEAMGVNLAYHKVLAFTISAFFAGVAGGMYASYLQSVDTQTFNFFVTFYTLGGLMLLAFGFTYYIRTARRLRPVLEPKHYWFGAIGGALFLATLIFQNHPFLTEPQQLFGLRRILLAVVLILIMIYRREGIMGRAELSWQMLFGPRAVTPTDEQRAQDAWLSNPELNPGLREDKEGENGAS